MKMFYSPSKGAMFNDSVHGSAIPKDAVLIPPNRIDEILTGLGLQMKLVVGANGKLILVNPDPVVPTLEQLFAAERKWRNAEFSRVMWLRDRHRDQLNLEIDTTLAADQFHEVLVYMQALRDWPQSPKFPDAEERPAPMGWFDNTQEGAQ